MKLRKLARQLAAAAVAGAMTLSLCMPALAETWDMSNTEKYPNGKGSWISVYRYADNADYPELNGQFLTIWYSGDKPDPIKEKDDAPVFSGRFETLDLNGNEGTTVHATLQDAHIEYNADSRHTLTTSGNVELTLSGSNTVTHNNTNKLAIDIDGNGWPDQTPGLLTIQGSGSLTAEAPSRGIRIQNGTLDVTDGTVNATAADNGIYALGNTVQVSGGTLCATATGEHGIGIKASHNGQVTVSGGKLTASGGGFGIEASENGRVTVSGGTLNASAKETVAITGSSITVNGGVLNLEDNTAPVGILSKDLNVTNGWLTAKGQTVSANNITVSGGVMEAGVLNCSQLNVSGGWVEADTLEPRENDASSCTVNLSGGNVKLKSVPDSSVTVNFSKRARLTITEPVSESDVSALVEAFENAQSDLYTTAYLRYKPADDNAPLPDGADWDGSYVVYQGIQTDPDRNLATDDNKPLLPSDIVEIGAAPEGDAGGAIAAVVLGSAAVWGGYEVVTRVILNELLPEGAAIPANRGQLALLVWNNAGRPEPAAQPAFADVADADMAKAAQWCAEQGIMEAKSADTFKPEGWTPKFNVIGTWNKAFPKH
ncbi:carbohydrate-binding domain-containing protein [Faecalibacterium sp. I4-3-84]|uniref:carbohydrate-binding domain-containing protein n=1 Tax=Faecalibacterium sp. I4-3-84 TaxID=2929495 RepID=UPI00201501B4|nr:carbohydrate-binding domain-containing protein [Faecalibacterium sp. I4-3-84]UQK38296.1 carbohydrate-binding domain-containing protein [Faecalibacterium sp. I4-3-84]